MQQQMFNCAADSRLPLKYVCLWSLQNCSTKKHKSVQFLEWDYKVHLKLWWRLKANIQTDFNNLQDTLEKYIEIVTTTVVQLEGLTFVRKDRESQVSFWSVQVFNIIVI